MISPALTCWPPKRLTPRRWAFESRPLRLDDAPFLCAISVLLRLSRCRCLGPRLRLGLRLGFGLGFGANVGDPHLGIVLPVAETAPVTGLVPVMDHVDLGASGVTDDVRRDQISTDLGGVADEPLTIHHPQGRQRNAGAMLTGRLVNGEDIIKRDLFLPAAAAHNRVHPRLSLSLRFPCVPRHTGVTTTGSLGLA